MATDRKLLRTDSMARRLRVPSRWLHAEAEAGRIPSLKAGRFFLFDPETVEKVLLDRAARGEGAE